MDAQKVKELLEELSAEKSKIFAETPASSSDVNIVRDRLLMIDEDDRYQFKDFVVDLKNSAFGAGIKVNGLDIELFEPRSKESTAEAQPETLEIKEIIIDEDKKESRKDFKEFFLNVVNCLSYELKALKGYFFIHLKSNDKSPYKVIILHDNKCYFQPTQKTLDNHFGEVLCYPIDGFKDKIEKGEYQDENFICLIMLSTKINDRETLEANKSDLTSIIESFAEFNQLSLKKFKSPSYSDIGYTNDQSAFIDEIENVTSIILTNAELSNDEEKLIKKLFHSSSSTLEYKVLKGGKSGSKVLEVRPRMKYGGQLAKRYVVKFGALDDKKRIFQESKAFSENIENYASQNYHPAKYEKNATVEGMKYTYASKDSVSNSYSYSAILSDNDNIYYPERRTIIEELFAYEPFELWRSSREKGTFKVSELYKDYIKPDKLFKWIMIIKGLTENELLTDILYINFKIIFDFAFETNKKICHGDLHSENFFKDDNGIYLIDFGFTSFSHAMVDHTALECSIKFKHIPRYIDISILIDIEEQLLTRDSFDASFEISTARKDIIDYFNLIKTIRFDSITHSLDQNSRIEYLISLFIMTCRQCQYDDLNQLYAIRSAEKISERIIQLIS